MVNGVGLKARDNPADEATRQAALLRALARRAPGVTVWAVPNGGKRTLYARGKAKAEGMKAGAPDLTLVWNRGVAFVEMKAGRTYPEPHQVALLNRLHRDGHHVGVFRTAASVMDWLRGLGAPFA